MTTEEPAYSAAYAEERPNASYEDYGNANVTCQNINDLLRMTRNDLTTYASVRAAVMAAYLLIFFIGVSGNSAVVYAVYRHRSLRTVRNVFIIGLSCSDLLSAMSSVVFTPVIALVKEWHFGLPMCHLIPLLQGFSLCFSSFTLTWIAVDRYILIVHPTRDSINKSTALAMLCGGATLAIGISSFAAAHHSLHSYEHHGICGEFCMEDWNATGGLGADFRKVYGLGVPILSFFLPLIIIFASYTIIIYTLRKRQRARQQSRATAPVGAGSVRPSSPPPSNPATFQTQASVPPPSPDPRGPTEHSNGFHPAELVTLETDGTSVAVCPAPPANGASVQLPVKSSRKSEREKVLMKRQRRTNLMLCLMVLIFAASWSLFVMMNFLRDLELLPAAILRQEAFYQIVSHCLAVSSTMWNPVLYGAMNEQFRAAFAQIAAVWCCCCYKTARKYRDYVRHISSRRARSDGKRRMSLGGLDLGSQSRLDDLGDDDEPSQHDDSKLSNHYV